MTDPRRLPNEHPRGICQACGRGYCASGEAWCDVCLAFDDGPDYPVWAQETTETQDAEYQRLMNQHEPRE